MIRPFIIHLALLAMTTSPGRSAERTFTDTSGRTLVAELKSVDEDKITIRRSDGRVFTLALEKLSAEDRAHVQEWSRNRSAEQAEQDAREKAALLAVERRKNIAEFCIRHRREQVGNGECWTLADDAFLSSGATRPGDDPRVWGRLVDYAKEPIEPGDIVEFRNASITGYGITGPEHTAVVIKGGRRGACTLAEQNWGGVKKVRHIAVNLSNLVSGEVMVYRPQ